MKKFYEVRADYGTPESIKILKKETPGQNENAIKVAKDRIDREKERDAAKHDRMMDRARLKRARNINRKTEDTIEEKPYLRTHHKLKNLKIPVNRKKGKIINVKKEDKDPNEYDNEGGMMKDQLDIVMDAADEIYDMVDDNDNLPEWCQNKITKAADYIDSVRDYMMSQKTDKDDKDE